MTPIPPGYVRAQDWTVGTHVGINGAAYEYVVGTCLGHLYLDIKIADDEVTPDPETADLLGWIPLIIAPMPRYESVGNWVGATHAESNGKYLPIKRLTGTSDYEFEIDDREFVVNHEILTRLNLLPVRFVGGGRSESP